MFATCRRQLCTAAANSMATLTFAQPIDQLSGNGTYRLRIGSNT
jgi:hypothetical protein